MTIDGYLKRLEVYGIAADQIPFKSDPELLRARGMGKKGLSLLREKYGTAEKPETLQLSKQVANALRPVLMKRRGTGEKTIRALSRMVAAYFGE